MTRVIMRTTRSTLLAALLVGGSVSGKQGQSPNLNELFEAGRSALDAGKYAEAELNFDHLLQTGLRTAPVYVNLGVVYLLTGRVEEGHSSTDTGEGIGARHDRRRLNFGLAYYRQRKFKQAVPFFAAMLSADSANVQAHFLKGEYHFMMDEFDARNPPSSQEAMGALGIRIYGGLGAEGHF